MLQSTNEPTESRRLKDASFMKRFRKCLMKVSSNPLKVLGHHPLCSRKKDSVVGVLRRLSQKLNSVTKKRRLSSASFRYLAETFAVVAESGVEFYWGPEEVEAFNSLKKALTSDPVLGMYDERLQNHTDAKAGTVSELT
ncbi:hypothetical protein TNCV_357501 [Trichonephila clavipes]|nr:hypothetical protein TNCV_357501 [Trichonephila clavipes]